MRLLLCCCVAALLRSHSAGGVPLHGSRRPPGLLFRCILSCKPAVRLVVATLQGEKMIGLGAPDELVSTVSTMVDQHHPDMKVRPLFFTFATPHHQAPLWSSSALQVCSCQVRTPMLSADMGSRPNPRRPASRAALTRPTRALGCTAW